jgi:hypothetical protein
MNNASIEKRILLRYRADGHLRFQLPEELCGDRPAQAIRRSLLALDGIYRVDVYQTQRKLSIRYHPAVCSMGAIATRLRDAVRAASGASPTASEAAPHPPQPKTKVEAAHRPPARALSWLKSKSRDLQLRAHEWRARAVGLRHYAQARSRALPGLPPQLDERTVINFFSDLTAFYLVKVHWDLITKRWVKAPFTHRYEWMTAFYLVFLLVRFRKSAPKK